MAVDRELFRALLKVSPFQPATAFWRSIEIACLLREPFPEGLGLDLGCGDGSVTQIILERVGVRDMVGVDPDAKETSLAERLGVYAHIHTTGGQEIPEADASFDFAFSNSVLEHIPDVAGVLDEVARVLKPGGLFVFTVPGPRFHYLLRGPLWPWVSRERYLAQLDRRVAHEHYYSEQEWGKLLGRRSLTIERASEYLNGHEVKRWETLARFTGGLLYQLMGAQKPPIEIQRQLGMRKAGRAMCGWVASSLSHVLCLGIGAEADEPEQEGGCLLIRARKH